MDDGWSLLALKYMICVIIGMGGITVSSYLFFSHVDRKPEDLISYLLYLGVFGIIIFNATAW